MGKFKKGQSGNPNGRPKGSGTKLLLTPELQKRINPEILVARLIKLSESRDPAVSLRAVMYIYDRLEGRVRDAQQEQKAGEFVYLSGTEIKAMKKSGTLDQIQNQGLYLLRVPERTGKE